MSAPSARHRGRPPACSHELALRIVGMHFRGLSLREISNALNAEGIPTPAGGSLWLKSHVDRVLHTQYVRDIVNDMNGGRRPSHRADYAATE